MKQKLKIMTILGTRPEIIRLSRILPLLDTYTNHCSVYTQQNFDYELSEIFFKELKLRKPDHLFVVKSETAGRQIGKIISQSESVLRKETPDALLVLGDTNSSLSAIVAKRLHIPIFHMEAGNRCYNWEVPEEVNRAIVDTISDFNFPYTEQGRRYLIQQGIHPNKIFVTGSPLAEVYKYYETNIKSSEILKTMNLKHEKYFVISVHREENVDNPLRLASLLEALKYLVQIYKLPIIVSLHPRTRKRVDHIDLDPLIRFHKPFGFFDYNKLEQNAFCVLSDSGTIQEESSLLGFPAVQLRTNLERQEAFEKGSMILGGLDKFSIVNAVKLATDFYKNGECKLIPSDYLDTNVSAKIVKLITSLLTSWRG